MSELTSLAGTMDLRASTGRESPAMTAEIAAQNQIALQLALNASGIVSVTKPGTYPVVSDTFTLSDNTIYRQGPGVFFTVNGSVVALSSLIGKNSSVSGTVLPNAWSLSWQPSGPASGLIAAGYGEINYDSTVYDVTGAGHCIGWLGRVRHRTPRTVSLVVGIEGAVESTGGGTISQAWGVVSHVSTDGAGSNIPAAAGFADLVDNAAGGTIGAYAGLLLNDLSAETGITYKYGVYQLDPNAWNIYRGRSWGAQQAAKGGVPVMPELAPAMSPGIASGRYYTTPTGASITTLALGANILYCCPFFVPERVTWTEIGVEVTTAAAASSLLRVGVYRAYAGRPQELILDGGAKAADSIGLKTTVVSQVLEAGWYFLAVFSNGAPTVRAITDSATTLIGLTATTALDTLIGASQTYGAMPATFPGTLIYANSGAIVPLLWMRK